MHAVALGKVPASSGLLTRCRQAWALWGRTKLSDCAVESLHARIRWRNFHAALTLDMRDAGHARYGREGAFVGAAGDDPDLVQHASDLETGGAQGLSGPRDLLGYRATH